MQLGVPKLRHIPFETAIIGRYRHRESSVEEALVEMYLAGGSGRKVEDITEALWGSVASPSTISDLNQKISSAWRFGASVRLSENTLFFVDGIWLSALGAARWSRFPCLWRLGGAGKATVKCSGWRSEVGKTGKAGTDFRHPKARGLERIWLPVSDKSLGHQEALYQYYPAARRQCCVVHFYRNVQRVTPRGKIREGSLMLKAIHVQ